MKKKVSFTKDLEFPTMIGEITEITLEDNLKFIDSNNIDGSFFVSGKYKMTEASILEEDFSFNLPVDIELLEKCELETCKITIDSFNYEIIDDNIIRCNIDVLIEGREQIEEKELVLDRKSKEEENSLETNEDLEEASIEDAVIEKECDDNKRECDGDSKEEKEIEIPTKNNKIKEETKNTQQTNNQLEDNPKKIDEINISYDEEEEKINMDNDNKNNKLPNVNQEIKTVSPKGNNDFSANTNSLFSSLTDEQDTFKAYSIVFLREGDTIEKIMTKYNVTKEKLQEYNNLGEITLNSKIIIPASIDE